jgi:hypothetical protein
MHAEWRYTLWLPWNQTALAPMWPSLPSFGVGVGGGGSGSGGSGEDFAEELYSHKV